MALEDEELKDMIPIYAAAAISDDHKDAIDPKSNEVATESPLAEKWDMTMKEQLDAIGQHQVFGDFVEPPEGRKAFLVTGYTRSSAMEQAMCCGSRPG